MSRFGDAIDDRIAEILDELLEERARRMDDLAPDRRHLPHSRLDQQHEKIVTLH